MQRQFGAIIRRMGSAIDFPQLTKSEVFAHLAAGLSAGVTVVTPNRRLAATLRRDFDAGQSALGLTAWESADIVPYAAFIERAYEDALYAERGDDLPLLLTPAQEQALWEGVIRASDAGAGLLALPETARLASEAWQLAHDWQLLPRLRDLPLNEDGRAFADWIRRYERVTRRDALIDGARLPELVTPLFGRSGITTPRLLVCYAFDRMSLQQHSVFAGLHSVGCTVSIAAPDGRQAEAMRMACADGHDEIRRAAAWARARLEANGNARIGIVVPDLARHRAEIVRVFSATMAPDYALPGTARQVLPFNVSLGVALTAQPLVNAALLVLELAGREIDFEQLSRLIRSPFLVGGETEMAQRARLDAALRQRAEPVVTLERLLALLAHGGGECPILTQRMHALAEFHKTKLFGAQAPSALAKALSGALSAAGFPGERGLDSTEYQTLKKWHEVVAGFAALDRVVPRTGYADAVARLRRLAADTLFQPETPAVPIQILGVLEAAGMEFDCMWVSGLSDEVWPPAPRPNPFLPGSLQRAVNLPQASATESLAAARRLTAEWLVRADEVVLSFPEREDDREFKPSPLILHVSPHTAPTPAQDASYRDIVHGARALVLTADNQAPPLDPTTTLSGGTAVIKDQAACPFRAFALRRLGAASLVTPHAGLDAMERGTLMHRVLAQAWAQLKTSAALAAIDATALDGLLGRVAEEAVARIRRERPTILAGRFAQIEIRRLTRLARAWLEYEKTRDGFTVVATEDRRRIEIGSLAFNARLDRVDELASGERVVIDYKMGAPSAGAMLGERPDEPQLPLYLVAAEPAAVAVAFAQVKAGDMKFSALARDAGLLPGVKAFTESHYSDQHATWPDVAAAWRTGLARIAADFAGGAAQVDPKQYPRTCLYCDAKPVCRIYERLDNAIDEDAA